MKISRNLTNKVRSCERSRDLNRLLDKPDLGAGLRRPEINFLEIAPV
jgi:hypothetical protein